MQKHSKVLICLILFISLGTVPTEAQSTTLASSKIDLTISGEVNEQLLDQLTQELKLKVAQSETSAMSTKDSNDPQYIDMSQFKKPPILNIPYANTNNERQQLDIIYPSVISSPYKVIVFVHGGAWARGDRKSAAHAAVQLATQQGYAVINVGYRLTNEARWPSQLYDVKAAIRFIRANAKKYRLDTRNIVAWGSSAGGHLVSMLAATNGMEKMEDLSLGNARASSEVQGVVSWYGISDITTLPDNLIESANQLMGFSVKENIEKAKVASPIEYINQNFPPIYMIHGTNDQVVPFEQSVQFAKKINELTGKNQTKLKLVINASHSDNVIKNIENVDEILNFVDRVTYSERKNPFRTKKYKEIQTTSDKPTE